MLRYGIKIDRALGISHGVQRDIAKKIKRNHERAFELWESGIMEAQFIASVTADPKRFTAADARRWAAEFDSWDIVDGVSDLFVDTDHWRELIEEFAGGRARVRAPHRLRDDVLGDRPPEEGAGRDLLGFPAADRDARRATSAISSRRRSTGRCARSASARETACGRPGAGGTACRLERQDGALDRQGRGPRTHGPEDAGAAGEESCRERPDA